jgi:hypothetical protein
MGLFQHAVGQTQQYHVISDSGPSRGLVMDSPGNCLGGAKRGGKKKTENKNGASNIHEHPAF